jgi:hypothetical protein
VNHLRANKGRIAITTSNPQIIQNAADNTSEDSGSSLVDPRFGQESLLFISEKSVPFVQGHGEELTPCRRKLQPFKPKRALRRITRDCFRVAQSAQKESRNRDFRSFANKQSRFAHKQSRFANKQSRSANKQSRFAHKQSRSANKQSRSANKQSDA